MKPFLRLFVSLLLFSPPLYADTVSVDVRQATAFADSLMRQQRFHEAQLEYERLATYFPGRTVFVEKMLSAAWATRDDRFLLNVSRATP